MLWLVSFLTNSITKRIRVLSKPFETLVLFLSLFMHASIMCVIYLQAQITPMKFINSSNTKLMQPGCRSKDYKGYWMRISPGSEPKVTNNLHLKKIYDFSKEGSNSTKSKPQMWNKRREKRKKENKRFQYLFLQKLIGLQLASASYRPFTHTTSNNFLIWLLCHL